MPGLLVGEVGVVPLEIPLECLESAKVGDSTAGSPHGIPGGGIQLPGLLQPQLLLHLPESRCQGDLAAPLTSLRLVEIPKTQEVTLQGEKKT